MIADGTACFRAFAPGTAVALGLGRVVVVATRNSVAKHVAAAVPGTTWILSQVFISLGNRTKA